MRTHAQIAAQVAVEAMIDNGIEAYGPHIVEAVVANGRDNNVPDIYLNMLTEMLS